MDQEGIPMKPGQQAGSLPPDLLSLVHDIECNQSYPKLIAAHVACVQMDTSLPRLSQLEVDLAAAQRSIGAAGGPHPAAAGHQAAAPEVDAFMAECLAQLVRLKAALESHVSAAVRSCEVFEQRAANSLGRPARTLAALPPQVFTLRPSSFQSAADHRRAVDKSQKATHIQGPPEPTSLRKLPSSTAPGEVTDFVDKYLTPPAHDLNQLPSKPSPHPLFPPLLATAAPPLGQAPAAPFGLPGQPRSSRTGRGPPAVGRDVGLPERGLTSSTAMLVRRCLQRDAQLGRAGLATGGGPAGGDSQGQGPRGPEPAVAASMAKELQDKLEEQYSETLAEVHKEILRKRQAGRLPGDQGHLLKDWWRRHESWPYPTDDEKQALATQTGLSLKQVSNWFINQRKRNWKH